MSAATVDGGEEFPLGPASWPAEDPELLDRDDPGWARRLRAARAV
jgi:hypothetical protein